MLKKCQICKNRKAIAIIEKKEVCRECFKELKAKKSNNIKPSWLDKYVKD